MSRELILKDDMGTDNYLRILQEDDGDIIVSVIDSDDKFNNNQEVQFCNSGGLNPRITVFFNKLLNEYI